MGSLFSTPVPSAPPVTYVPQVSTVPPSPQQSSSSQPVGTQNQSVNAEVNTDDEDAVKDIIKRTTRGRNSTIQTSYRGVLNTNEGIAPQRKTLLGE